MRVLFVTPYFVPDYAASSPMYAALAEDLARLGHEVTVLTGMPYYGRERLWEEYKGKLFVDEMLCGYRVLRVYTLVSRRTNVVGRLCSWGLFNVLSSIVGLKLPRQDVLYATNPFTMSALPLHLLHQMKKTTVIYAVDDIYPDALIRAGVLKQKWAIQLVDFAERCCYRRATYIKVLSEGMRKALIERGVSAEKVMTLPNFADTDFVRPLPRQNSFRRKYELGDKFVVLYAGNMGHSQGLQHVLNAAALVKDDSELLFVFVGEGAAKSALQEEARRRGLPNVRFVPFQSREEVPHVLSSADVSLISLNSDFGAESVPSKTYWTLASGRPIIASVAAQTEVANLIRQARCGFRVDPESPEALADAVMKLKCDPNGRSLMGERARDFVVNNYSRQAAVGRFDGMLANLRHGATPA